jgi:2'-5' RNA ligase
MTASGTEAATAVRNHWWWRPGWRLGRHFYACHLTMEDQPQLRELIRQYQDVLADQANLDLIPPRWLHMTMQGIGFTDEVSEADIALATERVGERLRSLEPPTVTFDQPTIHPEAIYLKAHPKEPVYQLRRAVYSAIRSALGADRFSEPLPDQDDYTPHVSIAYVHKDGPARPIAEAIDRVSVEPVTTALRSVSVLVFHRDHQMYEWTKATRLPIGKIAA